MSKASQRRMAEQQKRQKKNGGPLQKDWQIMDYFGPDTAELAPMSYWRCLASEGPKKDKHVDDERLESFFEKHRKQIETLHDSYALLEDAGHDCLPGIAFHGWLDNEVRNEWAATPMNPVGQKFYGDVEDLMAALNLNREKAKIPGGGDVSVWIFGLPFQGRPLLCMGATQSGAHFLKVRVEKQWIAARDKILIELPLNLYLVDYEEEEMSTVSAYYSICDMIECATGLVPLVQPESAKETLDERDSKESEDIQAALDKACLPYLSMAILFMRDGYKLGGMVENLLKDNDELQKSEAAALKQGRRLSSELESLKKRLVAMSQRKDTVAVSPRVTPVAPVTPDSKDIQVPASKPKALAARLGAFF